MSRALLLAVGFQQQGMTVAIVHWDINVGKLILLFKDQEKIYDKSHTNNEPEIT
jgi:hypothetical protein